jgi:hypothetical protein
VRSPSRKACSAAANSARALIRIGADEFIDATVAQWLGTVTAGTPARSPAAAVPAPA